MAKITSISDADLLRGVTDHNLRSIDEFVEWINHEQLESGTARISSRVLYAAYLAWTRQHPDDTNKVLSIPRWGSHMGDRMVRVKGKTEIFYYVAWGLREEGVARPRIEIRRDKSLK